MAEQKNSLMVVEYESALGPVRLTAEDVKNYLVSGDSSKVTDREIKLFMELCKYQRLNPFTGEAYPIKFGSDFQMVVGYETYKRRAEENPAYRGRKSGIVVVRSGNVIQKEGTCVYPSEELIGGWCRVFVQRPEFKDEMYKEVSLEEYNKGQANWKTKPATMIEKVAVSQALRAAFPTDYQGLYTAAEFGADGKLTEEYVQGEVVEEQSEEDEILISQEQRQAMFDKVEEFYGKKKVNQIVKYICSQFGLDSTTNMTVSTYDKAMKFLDEGIEIDKKKKQEQEDQKAE